MRLFMASFLRRHILYPVVLLCLVKLLACTAWYPAVIGPFQSPPDLRIPRTFFWPKSETPGVSLFKNVISIRKLSPETQKKESPDGLNRANKTDFLE